MVESLHTALLSGSTACLELSRAAQWNRITLSAYAETMLAELVTGRHLHDGSEDICHGVLVCPGPELQKGVLQRVLFGVQL